MVDLNLPKILTLEEVAEYLRIGKDVVLAEVEGGHLRGFKVGLEWRVTDVNLLEYINTSHTISIDTRLENPKLKIKETDFIEIGPFDYHWPLGKEDFEFGYETTRNIGSRSHILKIGYTNRQAAGQMRRRIIVWIDNWPVVEFAGGNDFESDGLLASIIKTQGGKQLRPSGKIPEEYKDFRVTRYDSVVQGQYASKNMAVIVHKDDLESMVRHAIIRATWKELI